MGNNHIHNWNSEKNKISVELAMKADQNECKAKAIENLKKQIDFLTEEIDEIKRI